MNTKLLVPLHISVFLFPLCTLGMHLEQQGQHRQLVPAAQTAQPSLDARSAAAVYSTPVANAYSKIEETEAEVSQSFARAHTSIAMAIQSLQRALTAAQITTIQVPGSSTALQRTDVAQPITAARLRVTQRAQEPLAAAAARASSSSSASSQHAPFPPVLASTAATAPQAIQAPRPTRAVEVVGNTPTLAQLREMRKHEFIKCRRSPGCPGYFKYISSRDRHELYCRWDGTNFECPICHKATWTWEKRLKSHMRDAHGVELCSKRNWPSVSTLAGAQHTEAAATSLDSTDDQARKRQRLAEPGQMAPAAAPAATGSSSSSSAAQQLAVAMDPSDYFADEETSAAGVQ